MEGYRWLLALWIVLRRMHLCGAFLIMALFAVACASEPMHTRTARDCGEVQYSGGAPGYPLHLPSSQYVLTNDRLLPSSDDVSWFADARQRAEARAQKQLIGQQVPIRSPRFGGAVPQCAPNPAWATSVEDERRAQEVGEEVGKQFGEKLGRIEAGLEMLQGWPHLGVSLKRILANPAQREAFLAGAAKDLSELPDLPTYSDPALARKALAGFQKGYGEGIDAAHRRAFLVNIGVDVYFMVIGNIAGALESAGAKLLDRAIMRLRGMPIFVPAAARGAGFFMKVPPRVVNGSSRRLLKALLEAKKEPLAGEVPHHVVSHSDWRAEEARKILQKFGVGVDTAENGVFLPQNTTVPNPKGKAVHSTVHTNAYYEAVYEAIKDSASKQDLINRLQELAWRLEKKGGL